jgi:hypothetical protein
MGRSTEDAASRAGAGGSSLVIATAVVVSLFAFFVGAAVMVARCGLGFEPS